MNDHKRRQLIARLAEANPSPRTELVYSTPFELLIAVMLSAQATDRVSTPLPPDCFRSPIHPKHC